MPRLYLDNSSRVFRAVAPPGAPLPSYLTANTVAFDVSDGDWQNVYHPAYQTALQAGQDLAVAADGSTSSVTHVPTQEEQITTTHQSAFRAFVNNPAAGDAVRDAALRALIRHLGLDA